MTPDDVLEPGDIRLLSVDNHLVLPANKHIHVLVTAGDVLHSFAMPSLGVKKDAVPGRLNETKKNKKWSVIIGPEGGFSEKERRTISSLSSCISVSLGKRILRSDTATTTAIFSIQSVIE